MEAGDRLAAQIGDRPVLCFVSPYQRTRQTADAVLGRLAAAGVRVLDRREDPRLREREFCGTFQREEPRRDDEWEYSRFFWRPPSGESCADVYDRITTFLETLWRLMRALPALEGGVVLVISHGLTNRIFAMRWLHWSAEQFGRTRNPGNCQPIVLQNQPPPLGGHPTYRLTEDSLRILGIEADQPPPG
jgi:broad specificity phosphatase PhoE